MMKKVVNILFVLIVFSTTCSAQNIEYLNKAYDAYVNNDTAAFSKYFRGFHIELNSTKIEPSTISQPLLKKYALCVLGATFDKSSFKEISFANSLPYLEYLSENYKDTFSIKCLTLFYGTGNYKGISKSNSKAMKWAMSGSLEGYEESLQYVLKTIILYFQNNQDDSLRKIFLEAGYGVNLEKINRLAHMLSTPDYSKGIGTGNSPIVNFFGYEHDDFYLAYYIWRVGVLFSDSESAYSLGNIYSMGLFPDKIPVNKERAKYWYGKACEFGDKKACELKF